jgi:cyclophilin family peptidyl-prolyl cis-trans isomerase
VSRYANPVRAAVESLELRQYLAAPVLDAIPAQVAPIGKTLQIPLTASDADGDTLTYTVTDNSGSVTTFLRPSTNTWFELDVQGFGTMKFQFFDDSTPDTVRRIKGLVESGFYNGLKFHRIIENFMIQGGDPAGNGTGGPEFRFDDEFDPNVVFSGNGQLAMANSGKDTNGSQFFITVGPQRFLDFNHAIFGQLVRGFNVLTAVNSVPTGASSAPLSDVIINSARVVQNKTDAVLQVRTTNAAGGKITVTVSDGKGGTSSKSFNLTGTADTSNTPPILTPVPADVVANVNQPVTINLGSYDIEGDAVEYGAQFDEQNGASGRIDNNIVTITPANGFVGKVSLYVGVKAAGANSRGSTQFNGNAPLGGIYDHQLVTISFGDRAISSVASIDGNAMVNGVGQRLTLLSFADPDSAATPADWNLSNVDWGDGVVDDVQQAVHPVEIVKGSDGKFYLSAKHTYARAGTFPVTVNLQSTLGQKRQVKTSMLVRELATLSGNILYINGTSSGDTIGVSSSSGKIRANVNGVVRSFNSSAVGRVEVQAYAGNDNVSLGGGVPASYLFGDTGDDYLAGGDGNDTLTGGAGKNTLVGGAGNDRLNGSGGRDSAVGGIGDDRIYGSGGNDTLDGQAGIDRIWGGDGDDLIFGGGSNDKLYGEAGNDTLRGQAGADLLDGGAGTDTADNDSLDTRIAIEVLL